MSESILRAERAISSRWCRARPLSGAISGASSEALIEIDESGLRRSWETIASSSFRSRASSSASRRASRSSA